MSDDIKTILVFVVFLPSIFLVKRLLEKHNNEVYQKPELSDKKKN